MNSSLLETESSYAQNGKFFLASTTLLFLLLIIFIFFHSFRHTCFPRRRNNRRHRTPIGPIVVNKGLQPPFLASLPTFTAAAATGDNCAVCMLEFVAGDEGQALPSCHHAFHSHCIDVWFRSHSNCPICRTAVQLTVQPNMVGADNAELKLTNRCLPGPIWCPRKALELEEEKLKKSSYFINISLSLLICSMC